MTTINILCLEALSEADRKRIEAIDDRGLLGTSFDLVLPDGRARIDLELPGRQGQATAREDCASVRHVVSPGFAPILTDGV